MSHICLLVGEPINHDLESPWQPCHDEDKVRVCLNSYWTIVSCPGFDSTFRNLLTIIFVLGVGFAALWESSELWESGTFTLMIGVLLISILLAVFRTESRQAYWIGFALFGWVYVGLSSVPSIEYRLITTKALTYLDSRVSGRTDVPLLIYSAYNTATGLGTGINQRSNVNLIHYGVRPGPNQVLVWDVTTGRPLGGTVGASENFIRIGHSLFALLAAWLGGQRSRRFARSSRSPELAPPVAVEGRAP